MKCWKSVEVHETVRDLSGFEVSITETEVIQLVCYSDKSKIKSKTKKMVL